MKGTKMDGSIKRRLSRIYGTGMDWPTKIHHKKSRPNVKELCHLCDRKRKGPPVACWQFFY